MITRLSKIYGKEVYSISGARIGRIADVAIDVDTRRVSDLFITNLDQAFKKKNDLENKKGVIFSYSGIKNIQDIVLISDIRQRVKEMGEEATAAGERESPIYEK